MPGLPSAAEPAGIRVGGPRRGHNSGMQPSRAGSHW